MSKYKAHGESSVFQEFRNFFIGAGIFLILLVLGIISFFIFKNDAPRNINTNFGDADYGLIRDYNIRSGKEDSKVEVVYFYDFQCPGCKANHPTFLSMKEIYKDRVEFVYKNNPIDSIHPLAVTAAEAFQAASEIDSEKAIELSNLFYERQDQISVNNIDIWAEEIGFNKTEFEAKRKDDRIEDMVKQDLNDAQGVDFDASKNLNDSARGKPSGSQPATPTTAIYVNGELYSWWSGGVQSEEYIRRLDDALAISVQ